MISVKNGTEQVLDCQPPSSGLSWDAAGERLAYFGCDKTIRVHNIISNKDDTYPIADAEDMSLSPDAKYACFMTRDGEDDNDSDGWRLNFLSLASGAVTTIGKTNDNFGLIGPFYWSTNSQFVLFSGFSLSPEKKRSYAKYKLFVASGEKQPYSGNFQDVYDQRYRFWKSSRSK